MPMMCIRFLPQNYVLLGMQIKGEWCTERRKAFEEVITDLELTELLEGYPHELSGE